MSPSFSRFLFLVFLVFSSLASSSGDQDFLLLQRPLFADRHVAGSGDVDPENIWFLCASWRFAGEANNLAPWTVVPLECGGYVREYMTGKAYGFDLEITAREAAAFARSLTVADDGKDAWVFDVDETMLSNLPYYADRGFGLEIFNEQVFNKWVEKAVAPAINSSLKLYMEVLALGFKIFLLTGRSEAQRAITVDNLKSVGFRDWEKLILRIFLNIIPHRGTGDQKKSAKLYKSEKRSEIVADGYRIHGNSGDQWSDLLGSNTGNRSFKLPNPMYYIP